VERVWAFDLDGTLIEAARYYGRAQLRFIQLMMDNLGWQSPRWLEIAQLADRIDRELVGRWGGSRDRFPGALVQCYQQLCEKAGVDVDEAVSLVAWRIGESAFAPENYHPDLVIPGVEEVLDFLTERGDEIFVVTRGDPVVQWRKWEGCELFRWFPRSRFIVVRWEPAFGYPGDKAEVLVDLRAEFPGRKAYMVGDSVEGDIIPAALVGMTPIYIPAYWRWVPDNEDRLPAGAVILRGIREIVERYGDL